MKLCTKCCIEKDLDQFTGRNLKCRQCISDRAKPVLANTPEEKCKIADCPRRYCTRGYCERHYRRIGRHGDPMVETRAPAEPGMSMEAKKDYVQAYKLGHGCTDCGYDTHPAALDFDHLPGTTKVRDVKNGQHFGWRALLAEIAKCEVVCANCHRIRTVARRTNLVPY